MRWTGLSCATALLALAASPVLAEGGDREARIATFAQLPDWTGQWLLENNTSSIGGIADSILAQRAGEEVAPVSRELFGFAPDVPWNEEGRRRNAEARAKSPGRKAEGWGFPLMMNSAAPLQIVIAPEAVVMMNAYRDLRVIRTDGKGHPPLEDLWPTTWGDSVGHWEGQVLVVDTIMVRNPNDYFHGAPALSDEAHYAERIWMDEDGRLVDEITITDPVTLAGPWKATLRYERDESYDRLLYDSYDGDRTGFDGEYNTIEPTE
ncbi:MAG TPA: hypothetical protein VLA37_09165 [Sphingomonadaceae bacterium]|nr:hypothetical protein [Sphingomonadaceae bacterium]